MDAVKYIKEYRRMCASFGGSCDGCPISRAKMRDNCSCDEFINANPEIAVENVEYWSNEHPVMTNRQKLVEVFGKKADCLTAPSGWWDEEYKEPKGE